MGLVWCLNKSMDLSNTTQGGGKMKKLISPFFPLYILNFLCKIEEV